MSHVRYRREVEVLFLRASLSKDSHNNVIDLIAALSEGIALCASIHADSPERTEAIEATFKSIRERIKHLDEKIAAEKQKKPENKGCGDADCPTCGEGNDPMDALFAATEKLIRALNATKVKEKQ